MSEATARNGLQSGPGRRPDLANLQLLRAVAALSVAAYHAFVYLEAVRGGPRPSARLDTLLGLGGVAIFFAISGFLMARLVEATPPWTFWLHRVVRIYPAYLAVVALAALAFRLAGLPFALNPVALTLAPVGPGRTYPLNVEWTLVFELTFYLGLFGLAAARLTRHLVPVACGWLALLAAALWLLPEPMRNAVLPPLHLLPLSAACMAFAGGLVLPALIARRLCPPPLALAAPPLLLACIGLDLDAARWLAGIGAVLLVGAAVQIRQVRTERPAARAALALGDWSYVLYLVHVPAILLVAALAPAAWPPALVWSVEIAAALAATALLGPLDLRLYRALRRRIDRASPATRRGLGLAVLLPFIGVAISGSAETALLARREAAARATLATLPAAALTSAEAVRAAIAARGLALPATLRGALDGAEAASPAEFVLGAWAFDPADPGATPLLAAYCNGRLAALDAPRRLRPDLATRLGTDATRRIGYRLRLDRAACRPDGLVAILVASGRMAVLERASP